MLKKKLTRLLATGVATLVATSGAVLLTAGTANAADRGSLTFTPTSGAGILPPSVTSDGPCFAPATNVRVNMTGGSSEFQTAFPTGLLVFLSSPSQISLTDPMTLPWRDSLFNMASVEGLADMAGDYTITMECTDTFALNIYDTYDGAITVTQPGDLSTMTWEVQQQATPTTTALSAAPPSPVQAGAEVTLTATITPSDATGSVQFQADGNAVGSPVTVSGGTAVLATSALPVGSLSLTAAFTGTGGFENSTSSPVPYTVEPAAATATTTALAVSGGTASVQAITYTATVSPSGAAGSVQFKEAGTTFATVPVSGGQATFTESAGRAAGSYNFSASFVPANPALFLPSDSANVPHTVVAFTGGQASETIQVEIPAGALTITVADNTPVVLATAQLTPTADLFVSPLSSPSNQLHPVTVTDTRAGNAGWAVSGQASAFSDGGAGSIHPGNLGWTPEVIDSNAPLQTVAAGAAVPAANGLLPGAPTGDGLSVSRTLASSPAGSSLGTAHLTASLELKAPTTTGAGTYTSVLTLTAI